MALVIPGYMLIMFISMLAQDSHHPVVITHDGPTYSITFTDSFSNQMAEHLTPSGNYGIRSLTAVRDNVKDNYYTIEIQDVYYEYYLEEQFRLFNGYVHGARLFCIKVAEYLYMDTIIIENRSGNVWNPSFVATLQNSNLMAANQITVEEDRAVIQFRSLVPCSIIASRSYKGKYPLVASSEYFDYNLCYQVI